MAGRKVEGVTLSTPQGPCDRATDGMVITGGFRPDVILLRGSHLQVNAASGGLVIDRWGRLSDPAFFAAGNLLRGVETAGWCGAAHRPDHPDGAGGGIAAAAWRAGAVEPSSPGAGGAADPWRPWDGCPV